MKTKDCHQQTTECTGAVDPPFRLSFSCPLWIIVGWSWQIDGYLWSFPGKPTPHRWNHGHVRPSLGAQLGDAPTRDSWACALLNGPESRSIPPGRPALGRNLEPHTQPFPRSGIFRSFGSAGKGRVVDLGGIFQQEWFMRHCFEEMGA